MAPDRGERGFSMKEDYFLKRALEANLPGGWKVLEVRLTGDSARNGKGVVKGFLKLSRPPARERSVFDFTAHIAQSNEVESLTVNGREMGRRR